MTHRNSQSAAHLLASIVEWSDDAIIGQDLNGTITSWNRAAERMFGYTAGEAIGTSIHTVIPAERYPEEDAVLECVRRGEGVRHFETERRHRSGDLIHISLTVSPIRDEAGVITGASKIARDISERKRHERALARVKAQQVDLQQRLMAVIAASRSVLLSPDVDDVLSAILTVAKQVVAADGYAVWRFDPKAGEWRVGARHGISDRFAGRVISFYQDMPASAVSFADPLVAEDVRSVPLLADRCADYEEEGIVGIIAVPLFIGAESSGTIVFYYRQPHGFTETETQVALTLGNLASATVTTAELYDAQRRSRAQAEFLAEAGAVLAGSLEYHETLRQVAGLAVPQIADFCAADLVDERGDIERLAVSHVDPEKIEMARRFLEEYPESPTSPIGVHHVVRTGTPVLVREFTPAMLAAGARSEAHLAAIRAVGVKSLMCVPLIAHGRTLGALTFVSTGSGRRYTELDLKFAQDVALRAALAVDNARAYDEVQRANRLKDDFLATFSHELRTPLNAILGYARMLKTGMVAEERRARAYSIVDRNASALAQIVEDVLDVSRIVSGKIQLNVHTVDLSPLLAQSADSIQPAADAKGVRIQLITDPRAAPVAGDPDRLQQVIWNLLANAVKFTPSGGRIQVRLDRVDSHVAIVVSDTGIGVAPEFLPHIFERFRQADSRFSREYGGLGLGLTIVRHIVEMHGGTISGASDGVGKGATFRVQLPVLNAHADPLSGTRPVYPPTVPAPSPGLVRLDGLHVLAVDDEEDALTLLREVLETAGARVTTTTTGADALALLEASAPDVLVSDVGMPGMDGFELIARVRQSPDPALRSVPAAALTAYVRSDDRTRALRAGFHLHLAKPVDPHELLTALRALTSHRPVPSATRAS